MKRDGLYDNTIIFLFSDHGYKLHRHKQYLYEGGIQMPLIVFGPGINKGVRKDLVSGIDISAASCSRYCNSPKNGRFEFLEKDYKQREFIIAALEIDVIIPMKELAVVTGRYKYLRNYLTDRPYMNPSYKDPWPVSKLLEK